jgi:hypothetical protein
MSDLSWYFGNLFGDNNLNPAMPTNNQNPINMPQIPQPGLNLGQGVPQMRNPLLGGATPPMQSPMGRPQMAPPPYALAAGLGAAPQSSAQPNLPPSFPQSNPAAQAPGGFGTGAAPTNMAGAKSPQDMTQDNMRKAMLMQYLMGGEEEPIQGPNGALPSGAGMKGAGGFQNDPNAGLLNSFPQGLPARKRFIGA